MDFMINRNTRIENRTNKTILLQPQRCSAEQKTEGKPIIIAAKKYRSVKANEFCYEETVPDFHGILVVKFVGEEYNSTATFTAHHVKVYTEVYLDEYKDQDGNHCLSVSGIPETILDYLPFNRIFINQKRTEEVIYPLPRQIDLDGGDETAKKLAI